MKLILLFNFNIFICIQIKHSKSPQIVENSTLFSVKTKEVSYSPVSLLGKEKWCLDP